MNFLKEKNEDIPTNLAEAKKEIEIFYFEQIKILKNLLKDKANNELLQRYFNYEEFAQVLEFEVYYETKTGVLVYC